MTGNIYYLITGDGFPYGLLECPGHMESEEAFRLYLERRNKMYLSEDMKKINLEVEENPLLIMMYKEDFNGQQR